MSILFCCGNSGCFAEEIDDEILKQAKADYHEWVQLEKTKRGYSPPLDEQMCYLQTAYNRIKNIHLRRSPNEHNRKTQR